MNTYQVGALIALLLASSGALALNRCVGADGQVSYSDKPCAGADQQSRVKIVDSKGFTPERRVARPIEGAASPSPTGPVAAGVAQAPAVGRLDSGRPGPDCSNAMRTYDMQATTRVKPNLIDMELARTAAEEACGKRVPKMREQIVAEDEEEKRRLRAAVVQFCSLNPGDQRCRP